jgi:hypothetical protein
MIRNSELHLSVLPLVLPHPFTGEVITTKAPEDGRLEHLRVLFIIRDKIL